MPRHGLARQTRRHQRRPVENSYRDGHIGEIAEYCESDVVNTYRLWLRYELFCGRLSVDDFAASEAQLREFVQARESTKSLAPGPLQAVNNQVEELAKDARVLAQKVEWVLASGQRKLLPPEALQVLMAAICKAYGTHVEAGETFLPLAKQTGVTKTDVMVMASGLLKAEDLAVFELGMWQSWTGDRGR